MLSEGNNVNLTQVYDRFNEFLRENKFSIYVILVDSHTKKHCLPLFRKSVKNVKAFKILSIEAGEKSKSIENCQFLWGELLKYGLDRQSLLINLGGGVVSDIGGFVASTFMRGITYVNFPTSLLGMVDASIGGKTGINFSGFKNSIGIFGRTPFIGIDRGFLNTLPERQLASGFAEMMKHGLISDRQHLETLMATGAKKIPHSETIQRSITIKQAIVEQDQHEKGLRKILNFGHTIGHAVESFLLKNNPEPLLHGEAIAVGIFIELYLSRHLLNFPEEDLTTLTRFIISNYQLPYLSEQDIAGIKSLMQTDKKNKYGNVNFVLLQNIGTPQIDCKVPDKLIDSAFKVMAGYKI